MWVIFMVIGYIKEENFNNNLFKRIEVKNIDNNYILSISMQRKNKPTTKKKLIKYIQKFKIDTLVFSKELEENFKPSICEMLQTEKVHILNGKKLMEFMEFEIVKYVINKQNTSMEKEDVYIIFKKTTAFNLNFLKKFIENFKTVNIVTNDVERLKNVQDNLLENDGILISVSNNKKKALKRAKYILNINLNIEELSKYKINRNAIIINIMEDVKYNDPTFDGINVNYFKVKCPDEYVEKFEQIGDNFDTAQLYESILLKDNVQKRDIEDVYERIKKDEVIVSELIGNNGTISDEELQKIHNLNIDKIRKLV